MAPDSSPQPSPTPSRESRRGRGLPWLSALAAVALGLAIAAGWGQTAGLAIATEAGAETGRQPVREVIVLLDTSAQAGPEALAAAQSAAVAILGELGAQDRFNVIAFGSRPHALYPASWPVSEASLAKASRFVAAQRLAGGRSLLAATEAALAPPAEGYGPPRVVSGGGPGAGDGAGDAAGDDAGAGDRALPRRVVLLTSRPLADAALLTPLELRLPPATRLELVATLPAGAALARSAAETTPAAVATGLGAASAGGPGRALLLVALALPLFLGVLGWTVRRGLAAGPVSE